MTSVPDISFQEAASDAENIAGDAPTHPPERGLDCRWVSRSEATGRCGPPSGSESAGGPVTEDDELGHAALRGIEPLTLRLLRARGIRSASDAEAFLSPSLGHMHDPSLLPGIGPAADRILQAIKRGERIVIYGDYDVDGITSTAILFHALRSIQPDVNIGTYVPHRIDEGYGLNVDAVRRLAEEGAEVIVTVDCGITALEPAACARALGVDLIITDHHLPALGEEGGESPIPDAFAVVHPGLAWSQYPFRELCGAGVAYKLAWHLLTKHEGRRVLSPPRRAVLLELLGLAAMGTVADVVPLVDENRAIVHHGLSQLSNARGHGLRALIESCGLRSDRIDAHQIAFQLGPRLNACGRLGHAADAVRLLTEASEDEAFHIAEHLQEQNDRRRDIEKRTADEAAEMARTRGMTEGDSRAIVLASDAWHPGVLGIVCSRLVEQFGRPTILLAQDGTALSGSARSVPGFDMHAALHACSVHLSRYGGHAAAAGLGMEAHNLASFTEAFCAHTAAALTPEQMVPELAYDLTAQAKELTPAAVEQLARLAPFGQGNPPPTLRINGLRLIESPKLMGKTANHLSLRVSDGERVLRLVGWRKSSWSDRLANGMTVSAIVRPKINEWQGRKQIEPEVLDLRPDRW